MKKLEGIVHFSYASISIFYTGRSHSAGSHDGSEFRGLRACSKSVMALQGEDTSATFASIAAYAILNWTLVHLNISTPLPQSCIMSRIYAFVTDICAFANE